LSGRHLCCFISYLNTNIITLTSLILLLGSDNNAFEGGVLVHPSQSNLLLLLLVLRVGHVLLRCGRLACLSEIVGVSAIRQIQWARPHLLLKQVAIALGGDACS
jgi:hypothetical protein